MNDITFGESPWELAIVRLRPGDSFSGARLLTLLEGEDEDALEAAFADLEARQISLDISTLPKWEETGAQAARLRQEAQMAAGHELELPAEDPLGIYLQELKALPDSSLESLTKAYLAGDASALEQLAEAQLPLVVELAQAHTGWGVLLLDLIQEGNLGLWQGLSCYAGGDVRAHCAWWIRQAMAKAVLLQARSGGVGAKLLQALEDYRAADERLLTRLGRNPLVAEIAQEMGISLEDGYVVSKMFADAQALEKAHRTPPPSAEDGQAVEDTAYFQTRQRIDELLSELDAETRKLLSLRFGLEGGLPQSPEEVGKALGLTAQEVVAREAAALGRLRGL